MPLSELAADVDGSCSIYIQYLNEAQHNMSSSVIFGSMFMQQFENLFEYDLTAKTTTLSMILSDQTVIAGAYVGGASYTTLTNPFTLLDNQV